MGKPTLAHQIICFLDFLHVIMMNTNGYSKQHVLRTLCYFSIEFQKVRALKSFKSEVIIIVISIIVDDRIKIILVLHNNLINFFGNKRCVFSRLGINKVSQICDDFTEYIFCASMQIINANSCCKTAVIGVVSSQCCSGLCCQFIQFSGRYAIV